MRGFFAALMRRSILLLAVASLIGCSSGDDGTSARDGGGVGLNACGVKGTPEGSECTDATECGPADNTGVFFNCGLCPIEAKTEMCVSGRCQPYSRDGTAFIGFNVNMVGVGAASYVGMVIDPVTAGGGQVTCSAMLSTCPLVGNASLNVVNANLANGSLAGGNNYFLTVDAHVGSGRIVHLIVTSERGGNGSVVAHACKEDVTITAGQMTNVELTLVAP